MALPNQEEGVRKLQDHYPLGENTLRQLLIGIVARP